MMTARVKYRVAIYSGEIKINCDENEENEFIIARAKSIVRRKAGGSFPFGSESWEVIERY